MLKLLNRVCGLIHFSNIIVGIYLVTRKNKWSFRLYKEKLAMNYKGVLESFSSLKNEQNLNDDRITNIANKSNTETPYQYESHIGQTEIRDNIKIPIASLAIIFSTITTIFNISRENLINNKQKEKIIWLKYLEYILGSPLLNIGIAATGGVLLYKDLADVYLLEFTTILMGGLIPSYFKTNKNTSLTLFSGATILFILEWYKIISQYYKLVDKGDAIYSSISKKLGGDFEFDRFNKVKELLPYIILGMDTGFPLLRLLEILYPNKYKEGEIFSLILNMVVKTFYTWELWYSSIWSRPPESAFLHVQPTQENLKLLKDKKDLQSNLEEILDKITGSGSG
jgi:hypothetical protein